MDMIKKCPIFVRSAYLTQWTILTPLCPKVQNSSPGRFFNFFFSFNVHSPSKDMLDISYNAYIRTFYDVAFTIFEFFFLIKKYDNSVSM